MFGVGITQVIGQQGVHHHAAEGQAMAQQDQPVVLGVLQAFGVVWAGQPGCQGFHHHGQGQLGWGRRSRTEQIGGHGRVVANRQIGQIRWPRAPAETQAHQLSFERIEIGGFGVEGDGMGGFGGGHQPPHQDLELSGAADQLGFEIGLAGCGIGRWGIGRCGIRGWGIGGRRSLGCRTLGRRSFACWGRFEPGKIRGLAGENRGEVGHLAHQAEELQLLEAAGEGLGFDHTQLQPRLPGEGDIDQDLGQHPGAVGVLLVGPQLLDQGPFEGAVAGLGAIQAIEGGIDAIHVLEGLEQADGGFRTHALHSRDVVGGIARERFEVHHLFRGNAELGDHPVAANVRGAAVFGIGAPSHVQHGNITVVVDQLEQIPVAREDPHPPALVGRPVGQGAEHIVGLIPGRHAEGNIQRFLEDGLQVGQVCKEVFGGRVAVGLVGPVGHVPEGGLCRVKGNHHPLGGQSLAVVEQGFEEAIGHRGGDAFLGAQAPITALGKGVKTPKGEGMAVDQ